MIRPVCLRPKTFYLVQRRKIIKFSKLQIETDAKGSIKALGYGIAGTILITGK